MRKVIDLCLDMPMGAEALTNMLSAMCLDPLYRGYKKTYGAGVAAQVGLTVEEIDAIYESEGRDGFLRIIREAAEKHAVTLIFLIQQKSIPPSSNRRRLHLTAALHRSKRQALR